MMDGARVSAGRTRPKGRASDVYLVADTRERAVHPFLETEVQDHEWATRQVNTGDYLICRRARAAGAEPAILACIERKTYEDFAASFKDGRYENVQKMRDLRARTGCALYFFVEGPAFPNPNRRFARIPYSSILAAMTKLMTRDGIFVVQTEDEAHTAKRLADFLRAYEDARPGEGAPAGQAGQASAEPDAAGGADAEALAAEGAGTETLAYEGGPLAVPDSLTARIELTDVEAATHMWARLRGISVVLGRLLTREFSVAELASGTVPLARLAALKTATGRPINADALASLRAVRNGSVEHAVKLVSGLQGITPAVAQRVLAAAGGLRRLCELHASFIAATTIPQATRTVKLGAIRAARIRQLLHYKDGAPPPADAVPRTLADDDAGAGVGAAADEDVGDAPAGVGAAADEDVGDAPADGLDAGHLADDELEDLLGL